MKAKICSFLACLLLLGCKTTTAEHEWPDGGKTKIRDMRLLHEQEASFSFSRETNGTLRVSGSVVSSADEDAIRAAFEAGVAAGKKIGKTLVVP